MYPRKVFPEGPTLHNCQIIVRDASKVSPSYYIISYELQCFTLLSNMYFFFLHVCFPASGQAVVTGVVPSSPRFFLAFNFYRAKGSTIPLRLADFSSNVTNSRSRAFRESSCAQEKLPTNLYEYALGGIRTHETGLSIPGSRIT